MIFETLIRSALMNERLVIAQPKEGHFCLKVKIGGALLTIARCVVEIKEPEAVVADETPVSNVMAFPGVSNE